jgi:hypothetical protein
MFRIYSLRFVCLLAMGVALLSTAEATPQNKAAPEKTPTPAKIRSTPKLEPVAETKLLMQGINWPNFLALEQNLKQKPTEADAWTYLRGEALLIAENGNLLMLRPPRNQGEDTWMERAMALRSTAVKLARAAADKNYQRCRNGLVDLADTCNRCHQSFRVNVQITAFENRDPSKIPEPPPVPRAPAVPKPPPVPKEPAVPKTRDG